MAMHQRWTLCVEGFARFKHAEVALRPLTLFVGENNSGKSYMASLLWGVLALGRTLFPARPGESKAYKACIVVLMKHRARAQTQIAQGGSAVLLEHGLHIVAHQDVADLMRNHSGKLSFILQP